MLSTLIESRRTRSRNRGATAVSVIVHALVIILVAAVTAHASDRTSAVRPKDHGVIYIEPPRQVQVEPHHSGPARAENQREPQLPIYRPVDVSHIIPDGMPPRDPEWPTFDPSQIVIESATVVSSTGPANSRSRGGSGTFSAWEVEKAVIPLSDNPKPEYPSMLQSARVDGEVLAQFVVDTTGRVDMSTFRAIRPANELFVQSVRRALAKWRFQPAEVGGVKVKQLVQMPLRFTVR